MIAVWTATASASARTIRALKRFVACAPWLRRSMKQKLACELPNLKWSARSTRPETSD